MNTLVKMKVSLVDVVRLGTPTYVADLNSGMLNTIVKQVDPKSPGLLKAESHLPSDQLSAVGSVVKAHLKNDSQSTTPYIDALVLSGRASTIVQQYQVVETAVNQYASRVRVLQDYDLNVQMTPVGKPGDSFAWREQEPLEDTLNRFQELMKETATKPLIGTSLLAMVAGENRSYRPGATRQVIPFVPDSDPYYGDRYSEQIAYQKEFLDENGFEPVGVGHCSLALVFSFANSAYPIDSKDPNFCGGTRTVLRRNGEQDSLVTLFSGIGTDGGSIYTAGEAGYYDNVFAGGEILS